MYLSVSEDVKYWQQLWSLALWHVSWQGNNTK